MQEIILYIELQFDDYQPMWYIRSMKKRIEPEFIEQIRQRIRERMEALGMTQAVLADRAGVSRSGITELMKRDRSPSCEFLMKIASELSVSVDFLLGESDEAAIQDIVQHDRVRKLLADFLRLSATEQDRVLEMVKLMSETSQSAKR